jgi:hypothetical protein
MLPELVREFFLLANAERSARQLTGSRRDAVTTFVHAAEARLAFAPFLADRGTSIAGVMQLREGVALLVRAFAAAHSADLNVARASALRPADELRGVFEGAPSAPAGWKAAVDCLATDDCLYLDRLDDGERRRLGLTLREIGAWLRRRIDVRSVQDLRATRFGRWAAMAIVVAYVAYGGVARLVHPNLAFGRVVTQSSAWPGSAPGSALVDGETSGDNGPGVPHPDIVQTNREAAPWVMIDLGALRRLREVRVFNRNDHAFDAGLPYVLELSTDGRTFREAARRTTHFGTTRFDPPWSADVHGQLARYVRVGCRDSLALSEVEVY